MDEATISTTVTALSHDKVASHADNLVKTATDDYNAQVGRVRALEQEVKNHRDWYGTANADYLNMKAELDAMKAQVPVPGGNPIDTSKFMTKEEIQSAFTNHSKAQGDAFANALKTTTRIIQRHANKFGGAELDLDAVDKIAIEKNLPLEAAYNDYIRPMEEEKRNTDQEARVKAAKEEGAREALSRHRLPVDPTPTEASPILIARNGAPPTQPTNIDDDLANTWINLNKA